MQTQVYISFDKSEEKISNYCMNYLKVGLWHRRHMKEYVFGQYRVLAKTSVGARSCVHRTMPCIVPTTKNSLRTVFYNLP
jgi:hypothetical protein